MSDSRQDPRSSGSDERLCSLSAAHAIGRRSAARGLGSQSDASDVIQMYSDIGRLQGDTLLEDETNNAVTAMDPLHNVPTDLSSDSVLRCQCYFCL